MARAMGGRWGACAASPEAGDERLLWQERVHHVAPYAFADAA